MSRKIFCLSMVAGLALLLPSNLACAQKPTNNEQMQKTFAIMGELYRFSSDPKLAEELGISAEQRTKVQIATQKFQDAMMKQQRTAQGGKIDIKERAKLAEDLMLDIESVLTPKQTEALSERAKERQAKQKANMPSQDQIQEMQRLNSMMSELQQLSFNAQLAEELGLTAEQRVQIREASQKFGRAMQERMKVSPGEPLDFTRYNEMMGDLMIEAQSILTPEQAEKLSLTAKLKRLKQRFGDEFAMINGLAEELELEPDEAQRLREEIEEAREDYYERLKELKEDTFDRIIGELPRKHRENVRDAIQKYIDDDPRKKQNPFGATTIRIGG